MWVNRPAGDAGFFRYKFLDKYALSRYGKSG